MDLDPKDAHALERVREEVGTDFPSDRLRALYLVGEAATPAYRPRRSPLTVALVLDRVDLAALGLLRRRVSLWARRRIPTPVLLDPPYIDRSRDVFPIEFLDLADRHRRLAGSEDPLANLSIEPEHLRLELEEQFKGKLLHLRESYLTTHHHRRLRSLLLQTPPEFEVLLRALLALKGVDRPHSLPAVVAAVTEHVGVELPTFALLGRVREGTRKLARSEYEPLFAAYLREVESLAALADTL